MLYEDVVKGLMLLIYFGRTEHVCGVLSNVLPYFMCW